ncbi:MAG: methionyl-tRNA formyltransferase [Ruminococcaceae bacterium]|nr:methionyl-tRNA formyltransferase [Oscillospiraceae bacterium]
MLKILFMGTPDFAESCLKALVENGQNVVGVVTQPDKQKGRGMRVQYCDVKRYALEKELEVYQPETLKDEAIKGLLEELNPDIIVVVAYGKILPEYVLKFPKYGCINVHGSLLPEYRGASPIQRAVIDGKKVTGVTTMFMDKGLDTGDMLLKREYEIDENANTGEVFDDLAKIGAELLLETLDGLEKGTITPVKQDDSKATYAEKIFKEECATSFDDNAQTVHNKIRGLFPFPGAFCYHNGKMLKLCESRVYKDSIPDGKTGEVVGLSKEGILVKCRDGAVLLTKVKPEGKGVMNAIDLINGRKISLADMLCASI